MNFVLTPEQFEVSSVAAKFLSQNASIPKLRELTDLAESTGAELAIDADTWSHCAELGWFSLGVPESLGGVGCGPIDEIMLFIELGRHLAPGPYVSTVIAGWLAAASKDRELAADIFDGRRRAGLRSGDFIMDGEEGSLVVQQDGASLELREIVKLIPTASVDPSVRLSRGTVGPALVRVEDPLLLARAQLLVSAMELGISSAVLEMSVEYAKVRLQFGKPIGTFQAVKHRCSDMAIRTHAARAQTLFAGYHVESQMGDAVFQSAAAKSVATKAAKLNTADNVQNHGAIGFTLEHNAGLFARRAHMLEYALGGDALANPALLAPRQHRFETLRPAVEQWFNEVAHA